MVDTRSHKSSSRDTHVHLFDLALEVSACGFSPLLFDTGAILAWCILYPTGRRWLAVMT